MVDQYGRMINYLRISVTDRCNLRCLYCMPKDGINKLPHEDILRNEEIVKIVKCVVKSGINKIRLTGGEPLIRKGFVDLVRDIKNVEGISEIAITTNGIYLAEMLDELIEAGLDRVNISLNSLDPKKYSEITRGGDLNKVLNAIQKAYESSIKKVKINTVLIGGFNDDEIEDFVELSKDKNIDIRFIELMPIGTAADWNRSKFLSNDVVLEKVKGLELVDYFDKSSPAKYYKKEGYKGLIGLINPISCNFCNNCNRIRLTSDGKIKPCLHSDQEIDLLDIIRNNEKDLEQIIKKSIFLKPQEHKINDINFIPVSRNMNKIGG